MHDVDALLADPTDDIVYQSPWNGTAPTLRRVLAMTSIRDKSPLRGTLAMHTRSRGSRAARRSTY